MISEKNACIIIKDENGKDVTAFILFTFEIKELNKKFVAYTLNPGDEEVDVILAQIDNENNKISGILEEDMPLVKECYEAAKKSMLEEK